MDFSLYVFLTECHIECHESLFRIKFYITFKASATKSMTITQTPVNSYLQLTKTPENHSLRCSYKSACELQLNGGLGFPGIDSVVYLIQP